MDGGEMKMMRTLLKIMCCMMAAATVGYLAGRSHDPLEHNLAQLKSTTPSARQKALEELVTLRTRVIQSIVETLKSDDIKVVQDAADLAGEYRAGEALPLLLPLLNQTRADHSPSGDGGRPNATEVVLPGRALRLIGTPALPRLIDWLLAADRGQAQLVAGDLVQSILGGGEGGAGYLQGLASVCRIEKDREKLEITAKLLAGLNLSSCKDIHLDVLGRDVGKPMKLQKDE